MDKNITIAKVLLSARPELVSSVESIDKLVMAGHLDFGSGMELRDKLTNSQESEDITIGTDHTGIKFPSIDEAVVIASAIELASDDEKESFMKLLDRVNLEFEAIYKKREKDIIRSISNIVEITGDSTSVAEQIMEDIKSEKIVFIKK